LLANDAVKAGDEHLSDGPHGDFVHPMQARPVEHEPYTEPAHFDTHMYQRRISPPMQQEMPVGVQKSPPLQTSPTYTHQGGRQPQPAHDHVPAWYQDMLRGGSIPQEEPVTRGVVHHRKASYG